MSYGWDELPPTRDFREAEANLPILFIHFFTVSNMASCTVCRKLRSVGAQ
jgi:hypothetical protein